MHSLVYVRQEMDETRHGERVRRRPVYDEPNELYRGLLLVSVGEHDVRGRHRGPLWRRGQEVHHEHRRRLQSQEREGLARLRSVPPGEMTGPHATMSTGDCEDIPITQK